MNGIWCALDSPASVYGSKVVVDTVVYPLARQNVWLSCRGLLRGVKVWSLRVWGFLCFCITCWFCRVSCWPPSKRVYSDEFMPQASSYFGQAVSKCSVSRCYVISWRWRSISASPSLVLVETLRLFNAFSGNAAKSDIMGPGKFEITRQRLHQFRYTNVFHWSSLFILIVWFSCKPLALWHVNECTCATCLYSVSAYGNKTNTVVSVKWVRFTQSWQGTSSCCLFDGVLLWLRTRGIDTVNFGS